MELQKINHRLSFRDVSFRCVFEDGVKRKSGGHGLLMKCDKGQGLTLLMYKLVSIQCCSYSI